MFLFLDPFVDAFYGGEDSFAVLAAFCVVVVVAVTEPLVDGSVDFSCGQAPAFLHCTAVMMWVGSLRGASLPVSVS